MLKIYFNHIPGNIHPIYQEMLNNELNGIEYINKNNFGKNYQNIIIDNISKPNIFSNIKNIFLIFLKKIYFLPNITFKKLPGDIVFSVSKICLFNNYILDFEAYEALNRFSHKLSSNLINKIIVKFLLKRKNCKKITFWSDNAKIGFQSYFGNIFDSKIEVLYPSITVNSNFEDIVNGKNKKEINILFVGRYFERKGGEIVLEAFNKLSKKYKNINLYIISNVDNKIINKYKVNKNIYFLGLLSRDKVLSYFKKSDIYIMPTFFDTFGMVFLEAFAYGVIPITLDTFAINNIINDGEDGFVINYKNKFHTENYEYIDKYNSNIESLLEIINNTEKENIINNIVDKFDFLISSDIRKNFIKNGFNKVKNGKFSNSKRSAKLQKLFNLN